MSSINRRTLEAGLRPMVRTTCTFNWVGRSNPRHTVCRGLDVKTVILHTVMILDQMVELSDVVCQHLDSPVYQRNLSPYARLRRSC